MSDELLIVVVLGAGIGLVVAVAYLLDRRRKRAGAIGPELPPLSPRARAIQWVVRALVAVMILSLVAVFAFQVLWPVWIAAGAVLVYGVLRWALRLVLLAGK